jgi:hypothetical protein
MVRLTDRQKNLKVAMSVQEQDAYFTIFNRTEYYPNANLVKTYLPKDPYGKMLDNTNEGQRIRGTPKRKTMSKTEESPLERSIRRSKKLITQTVLANSFDIFAHFTTDPKKVNRYDDDEVKKKFKNWLDTERRLGKLEYLIIPERHKDGALHFHALIQNFAGAISPKRRANGTLIIDSKGRQMYNFDSYKLGWSEANFFPPDERLAISLYVKKYITKDVDQVFGKRRYWASRGLKQPLVEENADWFTEQAVAYAQASHGLKQGTIFEFTTDVVSSLKQQPPGQTFQHPVFRPRIA